MGDVEMAEATITEELIASMRERIGTDLRIDHSTFNEEATRLAIIRFTEGIGDPNPLWRDPDHAAESPYKGIVAPPSFVLGCFSGIQFGWPGLGSFHASTDITFHRPVRVGDSVRSTCRYEGFDGPKPSSFANQMVVDHFRNQYRNQVGELLAHVHWTVINIERGAAKSKAKESTVAGTVPHQWADDELDAMEQEVLAERPRGAEPRRWEDVGVGDELDPLLKGPIGLTDEIAFVAGGGAPIPRLSAHAVALHSYQRHPEWSFRDPTTGAREPIYSVHYSGAAAKAMGAAMQYDVGFQRQCWQLHLLTNWIGDAGWVKSVSAQYRSFVYLGDAVRLGGRVTAKYLDGEGDPVVEVETWAVNQRGTNTMPGRAVLALPSQELGIAPAARRSE